MKQRREYLIRASIKNFERYLGRFIDAFIIVERADEKILDPKDQRRILPRCFDYSRSSFYRFDRKCDDVDECCKDLVRREKEALIA